MCVTIKSIMYIIITTLTAPLYTAYYMFCMCCLCRRQVMKENVILQKMNCMKTVVYWAVGLITIFMIIVIFAAIHSTYKMAFKLVK